MKNLFSFVLALFVATFLFVATYVTLPDGSVSLTSEQTSNLNADILRTDLSVLPVNMPHAHPIGSGGLVDKWQPASHEKPAYGSPCSCDDTGTCDSGLCLISLGVFLAFFGVLLFKYKRSWRSNSEVHAGMEYTSVFPINPNLCGYRIRAPPNPSPPSF